jgi:hypothetical protein
VRTDPAGGAAGNEDSARREVLLAATQVAANLFVRTDEGDPAAIDVKDGAGKDVELGAPRGGNFETAGINPADLAQPAIVHSEYGIAAV